MSSSNESSNEPTTGTSTEVGDVFASRAWLEMGRAVQPLGNTLSELARSDIGSAMRRYQERQPEFVVPESAVEALREIQEAVEAERARKIKALELQERQTIASEAALAEARRREQEARAGERRAYAIAVVSALVGLAGVLVGAWPYIFSGQP